MPKNRVEIRWNNQVITKRQSESMRCTSEQGAKNILSRRKQRNIETMIYFDNGGWADIMVDNRKQES